MVNKEMMHPSIQICSLEAAREGDLSIYNGVITIEDTTIENPFRILDKACPQLVLRFDDISTPVDDWIEPSEKTCNSSIKLCGYFRSISFFANTLSLGNKSFFGHSSCYHCESFRQRQRNKFCETPRANQPLLSSKCLSCLPCR